MNFETLLDELIAREGGFVNDPDDPGGATKYGITIATLSSYRGRKVSVDDVRHLMLSEAKAIYKDRYYYRPKINALPEALHASVFDMYVNAGSNAIRILQKTLNAFGENLKEDGALGSMSIAATKRVHAKAGSYLIDAYGIERREYYYSLADRRPASGKYARTRAGGKGGWIKRAEEFISERFRLTLDAHKARTRNWG